MRLKIRRPRPDKPLTELFTAWVGTTSSIYLHTVFFVVMFALPLIGVSFETMMLALTTAVSIEAIYLALFIQMTVNKTSESLEDVEESLEGVEEDLEGLEKDIDELERDIDDIIEDEKDDEIHDAKVAKMLLKIDKRLDVLQKEVTLLKKKK